MRARYLIAIVLAGVAFAEPPTRRPLTTAETAALEQSLALGRRVLAAWSHYSEATYPSKPIPARADVLTSMPTLELLHATHSLSDSDFALALECHAKLHPLPVNAPKEAAILTMRSVSGELIFDMSGNITLEPPQ